MGIFSLQIQMENNSMDSEFRNFLYVEFFALRLWLCQCYFNFMRLFDPNGQNKQKNMDCLACYG